MTDLVRIRQLLDEAISLTYDEVGDTPVTADEQPTDTGSAEPTESETPAPESDVLADAEGNPVLDFTDREAADAQAAAIGKDAVVVAVGTAWHVHVPEADES